jgi:hypothetical protein
MENEVSFGQGFGAVLALAGVAALVYFFMMFDTSVQVPMQEFFGSTIGGGRVNNLGLMQDRQNGILVGGLALLVGVILAVACKKKD